MAPNMRGARGPSLMSAAPRAAHGRNPTLLVPELLDALKAEYEALLRETTALRAERDELERKSAF